MLSISERARRYVRKCPPAISGQHGHDQAFHVAAILVNGFGLSESEALVILQEWNGSCVPPWSESDLRHKVNSVASVAHSKPRGWLLTERGSLSPLAPLPKVAKVKKPEFSAAALKRVAAKAAAVGDIVSF